MWKIAQAAVRGTSHVRLGTPCQDKCYADVQLINDKEYLIAILADGAGSASHGEVGAMLVCNEVLKIFKNKLENQRIPELTRHDIELIVMQVKDTLYIEALRQNLVLRDYACTLLCSIVSESEALFFQIGDGAIVTSEGNSFNVIFPPDIGAYANMTNFVTQDDVVDHLAVAIRDDINLSSISMFTDGLQNLAINFASMTPHVPFFEPMLTTLRSYADNPTIDFDSKLYSFLQSENINSRTDDDKTLILAVKVQLLNDLH